MAKRVDPESCRAWQLLMKFYFVQRRHLPEWAGESGLSQVQCHVLHLMDPGRPVPMGEVAGALSCDASNVTGLVDRLEARGLVARQPSPADRRVKVLTLTAAGRRIRAVLIERLTSPPDTLGRLSAQEQRLLVDLLRRILE